MNFYLEQIQKFDESIKSANDIAIFTHISPDGDTLGSSLAIFKVIQEHYKKNVTIFISDKIPKVYEFLPCLNCYKRTDDPNYENKVFDLAIATDVATCERMGKGFLLYKKSKVKINIDHHKSNNNYGDINIINPQASSASEVVLDVLLNISNQISFHDFRIVKGTTHINVLFDVVIPRKFSIEDEVLKQLIINEVKEKCERITGTIIHVILNIDKDYV